MSKALLHDARLAWHEGDRDRARRLFEQGLAKHPDDLDKDGRPRFAAQYLSHLLAAGLNEEARALLQRWAGPDGAPPVWADRLAARWRGFLDPHERLESWRRIADAEPGDAEAARHLLKHAMRAGDRDALLRHALALRACGEPPSLRPADLAAVGEALHRQGRPAEAVELLRQAVEGQRDAARWWFGLSAALFDLGDFDEARRVYATGAAASDRSDPRLALMLAYADRRWPAVGTAAAERLSAEIMVFTHVTPKLVEFRDLAAPGVGLIERTLTTLRASMGGDSCPVTVFFDRRPTPLDDAYAAALQAYCQEIGAALVVGFESGLRRQWLEAGRRARADLVFFVEHDWEFRPNCPPIGTVARLFAEAPDVNYLRLNKHRNERVPNHPDVHRGERADIAHLCRIPEFLNQPHFIRRRFLDEMIRPLIAEDSRRDRQNDGAGGVEETINSALTLAEKRFGLMFTLRLFGTFLFGEPGAEKRIIHLGC